MGKIEKKFTATLLKSPAKGGWTYVVWPESVAFKETRKLIAKEAGDTVTVLLTERIDKG